MKSLLSVLVIAFVSIAWAEKQPYERYQSIVDRQMFGPLPPGFDPTKSPSEVQRSSSQEEKLLTKEQEKLQSAIHFSVINVTPEGDTAVGFTDNSDPKAPVHYYLKVGEKRNGWEVKEADPAKASMTIAKGEIEVSLSLGGNSAKEAGATAKSSGTADSHSPMRSTLQRPGLLGGGSLRARRLQRQQQEKAAQEKAEAAAAEKEAERQAQAEQEKAQREAERAEQRQQLLAIQEELKRVREAKSAVEKNEESSGESNESN